MEERKERFEAMPIGEMRKKYYALDEKPPRIELDTQGVPEALRQLIPLAEKWGINDDILRYEAVRRASPDEIAALKKIVAQFDDKFDDWLAGPDAQNPNP